MNRYHAEDFDQLFDGAYSVNWQDYFKKDTKVTVDKVRTYKSKLNSEHAVQGIVQKAIYKKLGDIWHMDVLPESGSQSDVRVFISEDEVQLCLDLSGSPLHKRGYRTDGGLAPLRETTAAVMLQLMLWRRKTPLHDPFCGSGTLPIEACLYAHNVAPGFGRRFALENLPIFNANRANEIRRSEAEKIRTDVECHIIGTDVDPSAIQRARLNAEHACVMAGRALQMIGSDARVERPVFEVNDFKNLKASCDSGLIICNPPYGERLGEEEQAQQLYSDMASLFTNFPSWEIGVITANKKFQECFGHYASALKNLKAGNLDTTFYIYNGSEKQKSPRTSGGARNARNKKTGHWGRK